MARPRKIELVVRMPIEEWQEILQSDQDLGLAKILTELEANAEHGDNVEEVHIELVKGRKEPVYIEREHAIDLWIELRKINARLKQIEGCCSEQRESILQFFSIQNMNQQGTRKLQEFLQNKGKVVIVDPYLFDLEDAQIEELLELLKQATTIEIYTRKRNEGILEKLKESGANISVAYVGDEVHDRVWMWFENNEPQGISVGTSFNGLGKHLTFILPLPLEDAKLFWQELSERYQPSSI